MNITLFNRRYWIRRFGEQTISHGLVKNSKTDFVVSLHVHPTGTNQQQALPEGERRVKHLEAHSSAELVVANESLGKKGDLLYYNGEWYECINAQMWDHTILSHMNYIFVLVPNDGAYTADTQDPPTEDPEEYYIRGGCP